jgi:hypothetical protein
MILVDKMLAEMTDIEREFLVPSNYEPLRGYFFEMGSVARNGNWMGYVVLPDDTEVRVVCFEDTGKMRYDKEESYYKLVEDANQAFPMDSCAIDTMTALLMLVDSNDWDDWED